MCKYLHALVASGLTRHSAAPQPHAGIMRLHLISVHRPAAACPTLLASVHCTGTARQAGMYNADLAYSVAHQPGFCKHDSWAVVWAGRLRTAPAGGNACAMQVRALSATMPRAAAASSPATPACTAARVAPSSASRTPARGWGAAARKCSDSVYSKHLSLVTASMADHGTTALSLPSAPKVAVSGWLAQGVSAAATAAPDQESGPMICVVHAAEQLWHQPSA